MGNWLRDIFSAEHVAVFLQDAFEIKVGKSRIVEGIINYRWGIVFCFLLLIIYVANGYSMETTLKEQGRLERQVEVMRLKSVVINAELMLLQRASSISGSVVESGIDLNQSSVPPYKLHK